MTRNSDFSFQKCDKCVKETSSGWGRGTPWFISKKFGKFLSNATIIGTLTQPHFKFPAIPNHYLFFPDVPEDLDKFQELEQHGVDVLCSNRPDIMDYKK